MTTTAPETRPESRPQPALQRQFVNFMFFRVDRAFRSLDAVSKAEAKRELAAIIGHYSGPMIVLPYSTLGLKAGAHSRGS